MKKNQHLHLPFRHKIRTLPDTLENLLHLRAQNGSIWKRSKLNISFSIRKNHQCITVLSPAVFGHFLNPPGNHPRGAIFPTVDSINQSSVDSHCKLSVDWLIDWQEGNFDLIGLLDSYCTICFYGGGTKVTKHRGTIQYSTGHLHLEYWAFGRASERRLAYGRASPRSVPHWRRWGKRSYPTRYLFFPEEKRQRNEMWGRVEWSGAEHHHLMIVPVSPIPRERRVTSANAPIPNPATNPPNEASLVRISNNLR